MLRRRTFLIFVLCRSCISILNCKLLQMAHFQRQTPAPFVPKLFSCVEPFPCTFYTDGSCIFPEQGGRLSTWAIIQDCCRSDHERVSVVLAFQATGFVPSSFQTVQAGMTTGPQTINRAEFSAIMQVVASTEAAIIVSDSEWAISTFEKVRNDPFFQLHAGTPNDDLIHNALCNLAVHRDLSKFAVKKIEAHLQDHEVKNHLHLYAILGNREADRVAKLGTQRHISPIHDAAWTVGEWYKQQSATLRGIQPFLANDEARRLDAFDNVMHDAIRSDGKLFSVSRALNWKPEGRVMCEPFCLPEEVLASFLPGASILQLIVDYFLSLAL